MSTILQSVEAARRLPSSVSVEALQVSLLEEPSTRTRAWESFLAGTKCGHVLQSLRWAHYKQQCGWQPITVSATVDGVVRAACLAMHRSVAGLPIGGVLHVARGPVLDYDAPDAPRVLAAVLRKLVQLARRRLAVVRVSPNIDRRETWVEELLLKHGFYAALHPIYHTSTIRIDLSPPVDQLLQGIKPRRRSQLRRYERNKADWHLEVADSLESLETFYNMYSQMKQRIGQTGKGVREMSRLLESFVPYQQLRVFNLSYRDQPVSGAVVIATGRRLWYLYGGSPSGDAAKSGAGILLQWEIIKWAKANGYQEYDLWGVPDVAVPGHPKYGVYRLKHGWGGEVRRLVGEFDYAPYPLLGRVVDWKLAKICGDRS